MASNADAGNLQRKPLPRDHVLLEGDIHSLAKDIGLKWKDLARKLGYEQPELDAIEHEKQRVAKECFIEVMVRWMEGKGRSATAGELADALHKIDLKRVAEKLIGSSPSGKQVLQSDIEVLDETNKSQWSLGQDRNGGNKYLIRKCTQEEYCRFHEFLRSDGAVKDLERRFDAATKDLNKGGANIENTMTNEAFSTVLFEKFNKRIQCLTESLEIDEVKQDKLNIAVRLDFCNRLLSELQELYSRAKTLTGLVTQCDTILKEEFGESIMDGLRTNHNDLTSRVRDLESSQGDMSKKEKKQFKRLMQYLRGIEKQYETTQRFVESMFNMPPRTLPYSMSEPPKESSKAKDELPPRSKTFGGSSAELTRQNTPEAPGSSACASPSSEEPRQITEGPKIWRTKKWLLNKKSSSENITCKSFKKKETD